jgi:uncharacterized alpha/beta hydrolase family protein
MELWKILISIIIAVAGWVFAHYLTSKREAQNKRREIRVSFLIKAYQKLENAIHRSTEQVGSDLESVIADIQLFGSDGQIRLSKKIANDIAHDGSTDLEQLLNNIRCDLRKELRLSKTDDKIQYLRIIKKSEDDRE